MKIRIVSHASVIIETEDARIWSDPWLDGKAFNASWTLFPPPAWDEALLRDIDHLWISHEHPDHFHLPTLRSLPAWFKEKALILFQENNSDKMFQAFERLGFRRRRALPHRAIVPLTPGTEVYCYQEGQMNSCLVVRSGGESVINVNDAEIRAPDCLLITADVGRCDVVLNQFSIAGYSGLPDHERHLRRQAAAILDNVADNHEGLGAKVTIPFASFIYFSTEDNRYVNQYANKPRDVVDALGRRGLSTVVLYPGDVYDMRAQGADMLAQGADTLAQGADTPAQHDSGPALARFDEAYAGMAGLPFDAPEQVPLAAIGEAFEQLAGELRDRYTRPVLGLLRPFTVRIPDLGITAVFSVSTGEWSEAADPAEADLIVNSQPLHAALAHPFGVQTLGVSARYTLVRGARNWQLHRILFAMNNAEVYLRPKYFFTRRNTTHLQRRMRGGVGQVLRRIRTMMS